MGEPWARNSARRASLPREFFRNRVIALKRDGYRCQIRYAALCIDVANQGDHVGDRNDHSVENLRAACGPCHAHRSAQQGGQAAGKARAARVAARKRPAEAHPGLVQP